VYVPTYVFNKSSAQFLNPKPVINLVQEKNVLLALHTLKVTLYKQVGSRTDCDNCKNRQIRPWWCGIVAVGGVLGREIESLA
jgi:hypothetical protein